MPDNRDMPDPEGVEKPKHEDEYYDHIDDRPNLPVHRNLVNQPQADPYNDEYDNQRDQVHQLIPPVTIQPIAKKANIKASPIWNAVSRTEKLTLKLLHVFLLVTGVLFWFAYLVMWLINLEARRTAP